MILFNRPAHVGNEISYLEQAMTMNQLAGDGFFTKKCQDWFAKTLRAPKTLLTTSCTAALELAALLIDIQPGDEVIMPSYTFVSTANAFVLRGARIIFVDIRPDTMNLDEKLIEAAITKKTKAIVPVHYAGVSAEMDAIMALADAYQLYVIEDAAQGLMSTYKDKPLGTLGHFGCFSFHATKNFTAGGEGGALIINDPRFADRAEIMREKGTNRSQFLKGQTDKYTWQDMGSSYLLSEIQAAYLYAQLEAAHLIDETRLTLWAQYHEVFNKLTMNDLLQQPYVPDYCKHNAHMYYLKLANTSRRDLFIKKMKERQIQTFFHYVPLHSSPAGLKYSSFAGCDRFTTAESQKLVRMPLWYNLPQETLEVIIKHSVDVLTELYDMT